MGSLIRKGFTMRMWLIRILNPKWVIDSDGDFGLRILGVNVIYYKRRRDPVITDDPGWRYVDS